MYKIIIFLLIVTILLGSVIFIKPIREYAGDVFWTMICNQLETEEKIREQKVANGEPVVGRDTVLIWENMYEILHDTDGNDLFICTNEIDSCIMWNIKKHKVKRNKLYIISEEGFAIIDKDNMCKIYFAISEEELSNGFYINNSGNKVHTSQKIEHKNIIYLTSYEDFTDDEKKTFEKMSK